MRKDAAAGYELTRLRSTRARDVVEKTGVSASGKGVKVGVSTPGTGTANGGDKLLTKAPSKKKGKGRAEVEIVCACFHQMCVT
jgi:hypothetical protein